MRTMKTIIAAGVSALALMAIATSSSAGQLVTNGSFETIDAAAVPESWGGYTFYTGSTQLTGWSVDAGSVDVTNGSSGWSPASDGENSLDINGWTAGTISQSFATVVGKVYTVTFDYSRNAAGAPDPAKALLSAGGSSFAISAPNDTSVFGVPGAMQWLSSSFTFVGTGHDTLTLAADGGDNGGVYFDNVSIAVPEPATWALMISGFGMAGVALRRRRVAVFA